MSEGEMPLLTGGTPAPLSFAAVTRASQVDIGPGSGGCQRFLTERGCPNRSTLDPYGAQNATSSLSPTSHALRLGQPRSVCRPSWIIDDVAVGAKIRLQVTASNMISAD